MATITPIRVVGIPGSLRQQSYTRFAVQIALQGARQAGAEVELLDLRDYDLLFYNDDIPAADYPPDVARLQAAVQSAQGIILGTPEYHAGVSGVLKNALDLMGFDEFGGKLIGLIGVSGGRMGATNALNSLRTIGRNLHAWVIPHQVSIPAARLKFEADGTTNDPDLTARLLDLGAQVTRFASLHAAGQNPEFLRMWQDAPENPGG
ncbi:MAG: NAD(P)H-dependent oxidoreductase [Anaerolineae bacterium]|nr:NAD(P)H-dependent oxidoreductase [Anaerolineae bacterium]